MQRETALSRTGEDFPEVVYRAMLKIYGYDLRFGISRLRCI